MKVALITGMSGQDGAYLAKFLLKKGSEEQGKKRRSSVYETQRILLRNQKSHNIPIRFKLHSGDVTDLKVSIRINERVQLDEIDNLSGMSNNMVFFEAPECVGKVSGIGTSRVWEAVRLLGLVSKAWINPSFSVDLTDLFQVVPPVETTPFNFRSPYDISKIGGFCKSWNDQESHTMNACKRDLFTNESPFGAKTNVIRSIPCGQASLSLCLITKIKFGNLDNPLDRDHAEENMEVWRRNLLQDQSKDCLVATATMTSTRTFIPIAFSKLDKALVFLGVGKAKKGLVVSFSNPDLQLPVYQVAVGYDPRYFCTTEAELLTGESTKANTKFYWKSNYDLLDERLDP